MADSKEYKNTGLNKYMEHPNSPIDKTRIRNYKELPASVFSSITDRASVTSSKLAVGAVTADSIGTASITTAMLQGSAVTNDKIASPVSYSKLAGGTANFGDTNNGDGRLLNFDSSGNQITSLGSSGFVGYNGMGTELYRIDGNGFYAYTNGTQVIQFRVASGSANYGRIGNDGNGFVVSSVGTANNLHLTSTKDTVIDTTSGTVSVQSGSVRLAGTTLLQASSSSGTVISANGSVTLDANSTISLLASSAINLKSGTANTVHFYDGSNYQPVKVENATGTTQITYGTAVAKTAIMQVGSEYRALYCMEAPELWFMDFAQGSTVASLDPMFLKVTTEPYYFIPCLDGMYQVWGKRKDLSTLRFERKTESDFKANNEFWSKAKPDTLS